MQGFKPWFPSTVFTDHDADSSSSSRSDEFWKAPPANVTVKCLEFAGSDGIRSCAPMLLLGPFGSIGSGAKLYYVLPSDDILVHGEIRSGECHEGRIEKLAMEVLVSVLLRGLLGVLDVATTLCKWGQQHRRSSESYL